MEQRDPAPIPKNTRLRRRKEPEIAKYSFGIFVASWDEKMWKMWRWDVKETIWIELSQSSEWMKWNEIMLVMKCTQLRSSVSQSSPIIYCHYHYLYHSIVCINGTNKQKQNLLLLAGEVGICRAWLWPLIIEHLLDPSCVCVYLYLYVLAASYDWCLY